MMLIFGGSFIIITGLYASIFMVNINTLSHHISTGYLDTFMTKPVSLQFLLSCRQFDIGALIPNFITGLVMLIIGINRYGIPITFPNVSLFIILIICSVILAYSVFFGIQLLSFWLIKSDAVTGVLEVMWDYNNMPMTIYSKVIQNVLIFGIPLFVISNFPFMVLVDMITPLHLIWALLTPILFFTITRIIWKIAIKNYTSASS